MAPAAEDHATTPLTHKTDRSYWPALIGVGLPLLAVGAVVRSLPVVLVAVAALAAAVVGWLREAGREHEAGSPEVEARKEPEDWWQRRSRQGTFMFVLLLADAMLVVAALRMLVAHDLLRAETWPEPARDLATPLTAAMTLLLVASVPIATWATWGRVTHAPPRLLVGLAVTSVLGLLFLAGLAVTYSRLVAQGFTPSSGAAGSAFYYVTTLHALHVVGGLAFLAAVAARAARLGLPGGHRHAETAAAFWAFVVAFWFLVYAVIFLKALPFQGSVLVAGA